MNSTVRWARWLAGACALATVVVEVGNLFYADEAGFALAVRTGWALLRAVGFLVLMRLIRKGRQVSRPFGLILAVTTIFAVGRLVVPRAGLLPAFPVVAGFVVLVILCGWLLWLLVRSPAVDQHLVHQRRRPVPPWALTARVAGLSLTALVTVPALVAVGSLFEEPRIEVALAVPAVAAWLGFAFLLGLILPWITLFVVWQKGPARIMLAGLSLLILVVGPALCLLLLGVDGLVRDGLPLALVAGLCLYGLWASRPSARIKIATTP